MKKLVIITLVALVSSFYANAKVVRSRTLGEKEKAPTEWIVRLGASINNAAGSAVGVIKDEFNNEECTASVGSRVGMDFSVAFNKPIGRSGAYWGMELGIGSRGASASSTEKWAESYRGNVTTYVEDTKAHITTWNGKFSPFTIGYKYAINPDIKLDGHLGAYISYDFAGSAIGNSVYTVNGGDNEYEKDKISLGDEELDDFQRLDAGMQIGVGVWYHKFNFDITYQRGFASAYECYYNGETSNVFSSNLMLRVGYSF